MFILRLINVFGYRDGFVIYCTRIYNKLIKRDKSNCLVNINSKFFGFPIKLRILTSDWNVLEDIFLSNQYNDPSRFHGDRLLNYYNRIVAEGLVPLIIDCGANVGLSSIWYAKKFPKAKIVAIEPDPENFSILRENVSYYKNIVALNFGVSDSSEPLSMGNANSEPWARVTEPDKSGTIRAIRIDDVVSSFQMCTPFILKIDIEGFEYKLFDVAEEWIGLFMLIVVEIHDFLIPLRGIGHKFFRALTEKSKFDYVLGIESIFCYSHKHLSLS